jgi:class 3 adenylate cyclase
MEFRILGPLEVLADGRALDLGGQKQRALLAVLLMEANRVVSSDSLIEALWEEEPPETAGKALQVYVSQLRKLLGKERLQTKAPGYLLRVEEGELDVERFRHLHAQGSQDEALSLWRGPPLAEFAYQRFAQAEIASLEELRLACLEERVEADLTSGRHAGLVGELEALVKGYPLRQRLRAQLMLALYRSGRHAEALEAYQEARGALVEELGIEPRRELRELQQAILRQDRALDLEETPRTATAEPPTSSAAPEQVTRELRKTVTVLFADLVESTELAEQFDPESLRQVMSRYFEAMRSVLESHGGTVEKFIGDAVVAIFGVPLVHEDDALRAVRAAAEMRERLSALNDELEQHWGVHLAARIAVNTGEVVTGGLVEAQTYATGTVVNVASRLQDAAEAGDILIGQGTYRLVRDLVLAEPVGPFALKGTASPTSAFRLTTVLPNLEAVRSRFQAPMVGRERERRRLQDAFEQAVGDRSCQLFTVLGLAGVGKSRLAGEFLASLDDATVVRGRCLSYGEGITYWPVIEVLRQLPEAAVDDVVALALQGLLGDEPVSTSSEEIAWAFRKRLEAVAARQPLVCVFDDLHWGEETFLDLVEHVADLSRDAPILLLCMARPELLDRRPAWAGGKLNATNVLLESLGPEETDVLIESLADLDEGLRERIREAAEGNPLFVEEMVALVQESGDGEVSVPPTIHALLAARLDQLEPPERRVLEHGAVEGRVFHRGAVQAMAPEESQVAVRLNSLVRKELVRPDRAQLPGEDAFRFRHLLIRDAAYDGLPKATRAELHERFAAWLEQHGADLVELDEIVGYHLEQACRFRSELGLPDGEALLAAARRHLTEAGRRALLRQDSGAAVNLLERAAALVASAEVDLALEVDLVESLFAAGRLEGAYSQAGAAAVRAAAAGERVSELCCQTAAGIVRLYVEPEGATEQLAALAEEALPVFEAAGDDLALFVAYRALQEVAHMRARRDAQLEALEQALVYARRTGLPHHEQRLLPWLGLARFLGTTPVAEVLSWLNEQEARGARDIFLRRLRASGLAMLGSFEEARALLSDLRAELADRGATISFALATARTAVEVELLAGDPAAAVEFGEEGCRLLEEAGERSWLSTTAGYLAQALYTLDRLEEADAWAGRAAELGASDDVVTQMLWRQVSAKVLAHRGDTLEAEKLAREAVALGAETDQLNAQSEAYSDLAEVLALAGKPLEVAAALEQALERYERKGNLVMAEQARTRLEEISAPPH